MKQYKLTVYCPNFVWYVFYLDTLEEAEKHARYWREVKGKQTKIEEV